MAPVHLIAAFTISARTAKGTDFAAGKSDGDNGPVDRTINASEVVPNKQGAATSDWRHSADLAAVLLETLLVPGR